MSADQTTTETMTETAKRHAVAMVVFVDAWGRTRGDAGNVAEAVLKEALNGANVDAPATVQQQIPVGDGDETVERAIRVVEVMPIDFAMRNAYLGVDLTGRVWREAGLPTSEGA
jgi:hypothetical protein